MDKATVFTKTAKGIKEVNTRSSLSKDLVKVLKLVDGKSNLGQLIEKSEIDKPTLEKYLNTLAKDGFARVFETRKEEADPFAGEDDFDFTAAGKMPASTQRVVAGAANDISELVRQQEKSDADRRAKEQAHEAARVKAKAEAEARAKLEAEARAKAEAEQKAMEQAKRAKEAAERAKAELDAKMREEEARKRAIAEQQVKLTVEQKAKEEAEGRRLAELRVRAEQEAKALAEARARAEAEAAALAKARAEAEKAAQAKAAEAKSAEADMKAKLKEEIEARIRGEMEALLKDEKNEIEEKTREEMKAQMLAEARLAAKAELEERLREERQTLAKAEAEARVKAEGEARARAEQEAKLRVQAEARARAEAEARVKAEMEAKRLREESEARAKETDRLRAESEVRAKEQAELSKRVEAERQAKYEAEARAKIELEEREKREKELQASIEAERKAKYEAEARAQIEAKARETVEADTRARVQAEIEGDMTKRAEIEGKAQARAYMEAKVKAEQEEDEKMRADQARRAREIAEVLRTKVESDTDDGEPSAPVKKRRRGSRKNMVRSVAFGLVLFLIAAVLALHIIPLRTYTAKVERAMSGWLHDDVSIASMTFRLVPSPHLKVDNLAVGKLLDAKASTGKIYLDIFTLLGDRPSINSIELDGVSLSNDAVRRIPTWGSLAEKTGEIDTIKLRGVKLDVQPAIPPFEATLRFNKDGSLKQALFTGQGGTWTLGMKPGEKGMDLDFNSRQWTPPIGLAVPVDLGFKGTWSGSEIVVPEFDMGALDGKITGNARVSWGPSISFESQLELARISARELVDAFTKDIAVNGRMDGNFTVVANAPDLVTLFKSPRASGRFRIGEGSISNVDLVAVMQSETAGQRAGVTKFAELTGEYGKNEARASFQKVNLQGGVLRGLGSVDIAAESKINGKLALEIRSQVAQDRGAFNISGTVSRPIVRRGG
jgi:hypothetical protein